MKYLKSDGESLDGIDPAFTSSIARVRSENALHFHRVVLWPLPTLKNCNNKATGLKGCELGLLFPVGRKRWLEATSRDG
ncbi:MAG: hypothetical protein ACI8YQ_003443 [Polaribacter sp.]|jgi:hypothetical protein